MAKKTPKDKPSKVSEPKEDRSAFNCPDCMGEGLDGASQVCARCAGTGKV